MLLRKVYYSIDDNNQHSCQVPFQVPYMYEINFLFHWTKLSSVTQSCPTLCNPMDCSTPGLPVHCQLPEFTQTRVH